jgi:hypothetical protein
MVAAPAWALAPPDRLAGDVVALDGNTLRLRLNTGRPLAVTLPADARISGRAPAKLADIAPGAYVGATTTPQADGTLLASGRESRYRRFARFRASALIAPAVAA